MRIFTALFVIKYIICTFTTVNFNSNKLTFTKHNNYSNKNLMPEEFSLLFSDEFSSESAKKTFNYFKLQKYAVNPGHIFVINTHSFTLIDTWKCNNVHLYLVKNQNNENYLYFYVGNLFINQNFKKLISEDEIKDKITSIVSENNVCKSYIKFNDLRKYKSKFYNYTRLFESLNNLNLILVDTTKDFVLNFLSITYTESNEDNIKIKESFLVSLYLIELSATVFLNIDTVYFGNKIKNFKIIINEKIDIKKFVSQINSITADNFIILIDEKLMKFYFEFLKSLCKLKSCNEKAFIKKLTIIKSEVNEIYQYESKPENSKEVDCHYLGIFRNFEENLFLSSAIFKNYNEYKSQIDFLEFLTEENNLLFDKDTQLSFELCYESNLLDERNMKTTNIIKILKNLEKYSNFLKEVSFKNIFIDEKSFVNILKEIVKMESNPDFKLYGKHLFDGKNLWLNNYLRYNKTEAEDEELFEYRLSNLLDLKKVSSKSKKVLKFDKIFYYNN